MQLPTVPVPRSRHRSCQVLRERRQPNPNTLPWPQISVQLADASRPPISLLLLFLAVKHNSSWSQRHAPYIYIYIYTHVYMCIYVYTESGANSLPLLLTHARSTRLRPCSLPHPNPKYFFFHPSHQIFRRMYGALNVGKKDN
jgi:hypothetical protein